MGQETLEKLLAFFKVLADETRLRLMGVLAGGDEFSVDDLANLVGVKAPTISHHMVKLSELGLVSMRREGTTHYYRANLDALRAMSKDVLTPESIARVVEDISSDAYQRKVLSTYVVDGRIESIPTQRKKRDVVLRWLVGHFEPGRKYKESEVNEVIKQYHADFATLRREFIMTKMMDREGGGGSYWRTEK
ncbi:MAG: metalloregulator ArsR/SmtB family transcription factor [Symbiobacteriia bacterium]